MSGVKSQGTRAFYAPPDTSWTAVAAAAYPTTPWVEVTRGTSVEVKGDDVEKFDDSTLNDLAPLPDVELKPGGATFSREKDANSAAIRALVGVSKKFAFVYRDGTAEVGIGKLLCTSPGRASKGFANKVEESYEIMFTERSSLEPADV